MSQAHRCFGASGLSLLLVCWALDLKMLVPFFIGGKQKKEKNMSLIFSYRAKDTNGKYRDGTIGAENQRDVIKKLREQGFFVISVKEQKPYETEKFINKTRSLLSNPSKRKQLISPIVIVFIIFGIGFYIFKGSKTELKNIRKSEIPVDTTKTELKNKISKIVIDKPKTEPKIIKKPEILIDKTKFDSIYRVTMEIRGTIKVGVSYNDLFKLIQKLSAEIEIARGRVSTYEKQELLKLYEGVLACYEDSLTLWEAIIKYSLDYGGGIIPIENKMIIPLLEPIFNRYNIEKERYKHVHSKGYSYMVSKSAVQKIWNEADKKADEANNVLNKYK